MRSASRGKPWGRRPREGRLSETDWDAEKRDFVADERERQADARERDADDRESMLDAWEHRLRARTRELGLPDLDDDTLHAETQEQRRAEDRKRRAAQWNERRIATLRRSTAHADTGLATLFADIAHDLYASETLVDVLQRIVDAALVAVEGCDAASVTLADGHPTTAAASNDAAAATDRLQFEAGEGPTLAAMHEPVVVVARFPDARWPVLGERPTASGMRSAVAYTIAVVRPQGDSECLGSLTLYSARDDGFGPRAQQLGLVLAAHAAVAVTAVLERNVLERVGHDLREALSSRDVIGQAKGILMERMRLTPEDAFDVLRRASQTLNRKLLEVAERLAETGQLPNG